MQDKLIPGCKLYYPSTEGLAMMCSVIDTSKKDILVEVQGKKFYIPKKSIDEHAIIIDSARASAYVSQRTEDPSNRIVYLRYNWDETIIDRAYNRYCRYKGRIKGPLVFPATEKEPQFSEDLPYMEGR